MGASAKGSDFERQFCKELSLWWSEGDRDDIFWRTQTSGARATQRSKTNKTTYGQYGDVQAVDPIGKPLMDVFTIELKRGYSGDTIQDILDKPKKSKSCNIESFIKQAATSAGEAGTPSWLLVVKRDRRDTLVILPRSSKYKEGVCLNMRNYCRPFVELRYCPKDSDGCEIRVMIITWKEFRGYSPEVFV